MSEQLKAGEYVGADGHRYWLTIRDGALYVEAGGFATPQVKQADLRAMADAASALADELETEVVELGDRWRLVMRTCKDGELEARVSRASPWMPVEHSLSKGTCAQLAELAYEAGLAKAGQ